MSTLTTEGIEISVKTGYRQDLSQVENNSYIFNYEVTMRNMNNYNVQLISRDWYIFDSLSELRVVSGEGVIGEQPILKPNESFVYASGCDLNSEIGFMRGFYTFRNLVTGDLFRVTIPLFNLEFPGKMN